MKKWISILWGLIMASNILCSQSPDFTKLLGENMNYVVDMIPSSDGNFIIAGNDQSQTNVFVTSVNNEGEELWSNFFIGEMLWYSRITQKSNGNILIPMGNFNPVLLELNTLGDSLGSITITETKKSYFGSVIELQDSLIFVSEIIFNDDPWVPWVDSSYLVKVSPEGYVIEKYLFKSKIIMDLLPFFESQMFTLVQPDSSINSYVAKYNIDGELLSTVSCNTLNPYLHRLFEINSSSYIAMGYNMKDTDMQGTLSKFGMDCQIEYCNTFGASYFSSVTNENSTENIFVLGQGNGYCVINTVNSFGSIISAYQISDSLTGNTIINKDNHIYVAGVNNYLTNPRACFIRIHRDSILSGKTENEILRFKVFPNPTNNNLIIENLENTTFKFIKLVDLKGNIIKEFITDQKNLNLNGIKPGSYILMFETESGSIRKKIIVY